MSVRKILIITVAVVIVGFLALLGIGVVRQSQGYNDPTGRSGENILGRPAADFTLPLFSGGEITLSKLKGTPVVINFWASWCPPCREEAPALEKIWRRYKDKGVTFIGVDIQDKEADARAYMKEFNVTYPNGPDKDGKITIDYGVGGIPVTFFVNREGRIVSRWVGAINEELLIARIEEMSR